MNSFSSLIELRTLRETAELECKAAGGRDGRGQLPEDFWRTYSAFANSRGGIVLLGISEEQIGNFKISGIVDPDRIISDLFNLANNPQRVSNNILSESDVSQHKVDGYTIISVKIRRATRKEKPIYIGQNPLTGTYRRYHDGDRRCDTETVKRLLAEQVGDTRDGQILKGFGVADLDAESIRSFRQSLRDAHPTNLALDSEGTEFLRLVGAWRRDREA